MVPNYRQWSHWSKDIGLTQVSNCFIPSWLTTHVHPSVPRDHKLLFSFLELNLVVQKGQSSVKDFV